MEPKNWVKLEFPSETVNVSFVRTTVAMFASQLTFSLEEIEDIKVAISEAVSNCVIHGYRDKYGNIFVQASHDGDELEVKITDYGHGIADIEQAKEAGYTTVPEERMGLGMAFMHEYMDRVLISSEVGTGTTVILYKKAKQCVTS